MTGLSSAVETRPEIRANWKLLADRIIPTPAGPDLTKLRLLNLGRSVDQARSCRQTNHGITEATLREDFEIDERL